MDTLAYRSARRHVRFYARQPKLMQEHQLAMESRECEDFLQLGVDTFRWIRRAEDELRETIYMGSRRNDCEISDALDKLYHLWLLPVHFAEQWIAVQESRGYQLDNLHDFRQACEQVREIVENRDWSRVAAQSRLACTEPEDW